MSVQLDCEADAPVSDVGSPLFPVRRVVGDESEVGAPSRPQMTINGKAVRSPESYPVVNPATEDVVGYAPICSWEQLDEAVAAANRAFPAWSALGDGRRREHLEAFISAIEAQRDALAELLVLEQGKPRARAHGEINSALSYCRAFAEMSIDVEVLEDTPLRRVELRRRPVGVVGAITPWNYPILLAFWKIAPALLSGNTVVLKPSPLTPLTTLRLGELALDVLPPGVLNVVSGELAGTWMTSHPGIAKISFTGSISTGKKIMASVAPTLKRLTLELGGNDAGIVLADIDLATAASDLFWAAFSNCGQVCAGLKRLYVPEEIYDVTCDALVEIARSVVVGDGRISDVQVGPIQNRAQFRKVVDIVDDARQSGGQVIHGGAPYGGRGYFYPVTLVRDVAEGARLVDEEQFGPVLPIIKYRGVDEAVRRANTTLYGLGGSVWGHDVEAAAKIAGRLEAGSAWVNQHPAMSPHIPFGGIKESGLGVELSRHGMEAYSNLFVVNIKKPT